MAQNTLSKQLAGGIVIKYADTSYLTNDALMKLRGAIDAARRAVDDSVSVLWDVLQAPKLDLSTIGELTYKTLRMHFRLDQPRRNETTRQTEWHTWRADIQKVARNLRAVHEGLMRRPLTIADAFASTVGREIDSQLRRFASEQPDAGAAIRDDRVGAVLEKARAEGTAKALGMRGVVSPRKATVAQMAPEVVQKFLANDLTVHLTPEEQGSIKINFLLLLGDTSVSIVSVARTIIHEASHKFVYTRDFAYAGQDAYFQMGKAEATMNADSYAYAAISLYKRHLFVSDQDVRAAPKGVNMNA